MDVSNPRSVIRFALAICSLLVATGSTSLHAQEPTVPQSVAPPASSPAYTCACEAQAAPQPQLPEYGGCICCRSFLTGDWHGHRTCWAKNGLTVAADTTQFYMGVTNGGLEREFRYAGHNDLVINMDMGKLGDHEGLFVKLRAESRFGESINDATGVILPPTIPTDLPVADSNDVYLTNVLFTQALSESFAVFAGKLDTFDGDANAFASGRGKTQFSNIGFVVNPALLRTVPYATLGTGFIILQEGEPVFTFSVLNAIDTTRTAGFDELFENGVVLTGELRVPTSLAGFPGHQLFGASWSSREYTSLGQDPRILLPNIPVATATDSWAAYWNFDQYLVLYEGEETSGWGVFGRAAIADDDTNPIETFLSAGIGGDSPICGREEKDTFGIGWFRSDSSDQLGPIIQTAFGPIGAGQGVELYYNMQVKPWFNLTPDVQFLNPARENVPSSVLCGLRGQLTF